MPSDMMEVVTSLRAWDDQHKAALINNYGASGSNASIVVTQAPTGRAVASFTQVGAIPFRISGHDSRAITAYCAKLIPALEARPDVDLGSFAFNVNRQFNPSLTRHMVFSCRSMADLRQKISDTAASPGATDADMVDSQPGRSVILCFGGQVSTYIGLDRNVYDAVSILRHHLDRCDSSMQSHGLGSIYPDIFMRTPQDTVKLQTMLFALQYACAMSWLDSGLSTKVAAVTGHSFGEITALCVSGALGLEDAINLVVGRARLVRDAWGPDPGAMMAVESDEDHIRELLVESNRSGDSLHAAEIACYNGPRSFTLAGSTRAIERVAETISSIDKFSSIKSKWLNVTNAFHSSIVDHLTLELEKVGEGLEFKEPRIPLERATPDRSHSKLGAKFVADHMRNPVYFNHAIQRLAREHPSAIFLEAGSSSTITIMASRALAGPAISKSQHFQAINITSDRGLDNLTDATLALWKQGLNVSLWAHHPIQASDYPNVMIPPYQFEKFRHWLDLKSPLEAVKLAAASLIPPAPAITSEQGVSDEANSLWTCITSEGNGQGFPSNAERLRFRVNTESDAYKSFISGHLIAQAAPICPATLMVDMAIEALFSIHVEWKEKGLLPVIHDMVNHTPLCVDHSRTTYLDFECLDSQATRWKWRISSIVPNEGDQVETHVEAEMRIRDPTDADYQAEFSRFERLVSHTSCTGMLKLGLGGNHDEEGDVLTGRNIYRTFADVVDYGDMYRGVKAIVGRASECTGHVQKKPSGKTWLDVPLSDSFSQVSGIWVNCMTDCDPADMFIATGCELSMRSPHAREATDQSQESWHVLSRHTRQAEKLYIADLFVFNAATGALREVMLGIQYARVAKASMRRMLTRLTTDTSVLKVKPMPEAKPSTTSSGPAPIASSEQAPIADPSMREEEAKQTHAKATSRPDITEDVKNLVATVAGIEAEEITLDSEMADFGIDSLMGMEVAREVQVVFKCTLDQEELIEATSLRKFVICISNALYGPAEQGRSDPSGQSSSSSFAFSEGVGTGTPATPPEHSEEQAPISLSVKPSSSMDAPPAASSLKLSQSDILASFAEVKVLCDQQLRDYKIDNIDRVVLAGSNRLCAALVVEAFEELGVSLRSASAGQILGRVPFQPPHGRLMEFIYRFLRDDARLIDIDEVTERVTRTRIAAPHKTSSQILEEQLASHPEFVVANKLTYYAGKHLASVLSGKTDGLRVIFGTTEGRELVQALYCEHTFNRMNYNHMRLVIENLVGRFRDLQPVDTLKVLEVGAGTGGTTYVLAPILARLGIPIEYTFTDISGSMVANARRKFGKLYPFMRFSVHDIEKTPTEQLRGQHIIIGSNAVHATRSLVASAANLRSALRPDGFLMMLEMTESVPFVDVIFGLLEGWWLFDDGRKHAIITAEEWESNLHRAGYGHVDWTDGTLPENTFQKVIIALASGKPQERLPKSTLDNGAVTPTPTPEQAAAREAEASPKP
ncbi:hypothetical protein NM208_g8458 [Fusarium decemcellulare]|uniref:Uncharacterized protein n=1 Tax=Fusarium decemcellulare TaxID=57161 RepID=A0ACC1S585_9HYPO|nr:hypothetical protein NM208_g8458 [Fusarium decemcellulare]